MRILQVIPVFSDPFGGPVTVVRSISKELAKRHEVTVYTTNALDQKNDFENRPSEDYVDGYQVVYFPRIFKFSGFNISPTMEKALRETLSDYDIIHLHSWRHFQDIVVNHYAEKYNIPYVLQAHGSIPKIIAKKRLKWIFDTFVGYRLLRDASKVIALNRVEVEQYKGMGVPQEKIAIIPNGIDLSEYTNLPPRGCFKKKFNIKDDEKIILYVGRIHESKGLDLLAHAFKIVSEDVSNVRLVVIGPDDGYATAFSRLIASLGIEEKVFFTGFVDKRDKLAAFVDSDVFVTPRFSGFPVTFLEACFAGCPIVTTSDELPWIKDNVGFVVRNSPVSIAKAIFDIVQNEMTHKKLSINCKDVINNFSISKVTAILEDTYKSVMNRQVL